jgi:YbbR domain-containing protein
VIGRILDHLGTFALATILATVVWVIAVNQENPFVRDLYPELIPIEVVNKPDGMVLFSEEVESTQVSVQAPQSSWDDLSVSKFRAQIDLANLPPGLHDVSVQVACSDSRVRILERRPDQIAVRLEHLAIRDVPTAIEVLDSPALGYEAALLSASPPTVTVSGPASIVDQVVAVAGELRLREAKSAVLARVFVSPRNAQGEAVGWVDWTPKEIEVEVPIEQKLGFKDVSVRAIVMGQVAPGYWISNITVEPSAVTLIGSPDALAELTGYAETNVVNVSHAEETVTERVTLNLPEDISVVPASDAGGEGIRVMVEIAATMGGRTIQRWVEVQGMAHGLQAHPSPEYVDVILSGPLSQLQALRTQQVRVMIDLFNLAAGTHRVPPTVIVPEGLKVESIVPNAIEVEISVIPPVPLITPTFTPVPAPTARPSGDPTPTRRALEGV